MGAESAPLIDAIQIPSNRSGLSIPEARHRWRRSRHFERCNESRACGDAVVGHESLSTCGGFSVAGGLENKSCLYKLFKAGCTETHGAQDAVYL